MKFRELKDFCNSLPESELDKNVILWRENAEDVITEIDAEQLEEDYYVKIDDEEEGCMPLFEVESLIKNDPEEHPNGIDHFRIVYRKGHPILSENF